MAVNVFLDANVLVPIALTDTLLRLGNVGLIDPHWSGQVLNEVEEALHRIHPDMATDKIRRRFDAMNAGFEYAMVAVDDEAISRFALPDPDDRHVPAGAILCEATVIVTNDAKGFPASTLAEHGI